MADCVHKLILIMDNIKQNIILCATIAQESNCYEFDARLLSDVHSQKSPPQFLLTNNNGRINNSIILYTLVLSIS